MLADSKFMLNSIISANGIQAIYTYKKEYYNSKNRSFEKIIFKNN